MKKVLGACVFLLAFACLAAATEQGFQDPLLDHMTGQWVLEGTIAGQKTAHDITVAWVLNHEYIQFHETAREKDAQGRPAYEAIVFLGWDKKLSQYACLWLDTTSGDGLAAPQIIGHGKRSGDEIVFLFNATDGSVFHTTFAYKPAEDTWQWLMDNEEHGKLQPFARVTLRKK